MQFQMIFRGEVVMENFYYSGKFHKWVGYMFISVAFIISFSFSAEAKTCPKMDDHSLSAVHYKLFTAFQVAYDGYAGVCENKCFSNPNCISDCQADRGLASLSKKLKELNHSLETQSCMSHAKVCFNQCKDLGEACEKTCGWEADAASL